jgi:hypothetical protein
MVLNAFYDPLCLKQVVRACNFRDVIVHHPFQKFMVAEPPVYMGAFMAWHMEGYGILFQVVCDKIVDGSFR